mgnify:FL=1
MSRFRANSNVIEVRLDPTEIAIMSRLTNLLGSAGVEKDDPARSHLNPRLYPDDEAASREFERLTAKESAEMRSTDRQRFADAVAAAGGGTIALTVEDAGSWARVFAESRIVLAARRGLFETGMPSGGPSDPEVALITLLGDFQEELVTELTKIMEETE